MKKICVRAVPVFCMKTGKKLGVAEGKLHEAIRRSLTVSRTTNMMSGGGNRPWGWRPPQSR